MDKQRIIQYQSDFDKIAHFINNADSSEQVEVWFARELQTLLGYARWENFIIAVNRAIDSCKTQGNNVDDHFREVTKMIEIGKGGKRIRSKGDTVLFGGHTTDDMKKRLGIKSNRPLADFLPTLTIAAKNLATEITNYNVEEKDLHGEQPIMTEHVQNNKTVREMTFHLPKTLRSWNVALKVIRTIADRGKRGFGKSKTRG